MCAPCMCFWGRLELGRFSASGSRGLHASGLVHVLVHRDPADEADAGRERASSPHGPHPPRRVRRDGADAARVAYRLCGEWRRRRRRLAQATAFPTPCGRPVRHERERAMRLEEADAGEVRRRRRRCGVVDGPGQSKWTRRPWATTGCATPGGGVVMKSRRPPGELRFMAFASSPRVGWVRCACAGCM